MTPKDPIDDAPQFKGAVIVIPTRNRPDLAINAIRSALSQPDCDVKVVVSDNSTEPEAIVALSDHCRELSDGRLRYLKPPQPLAMSAHWDWALQQSMQIDASHFAFLSDRMVFRPNALKLVLSIVEQYPDKVLTYLHDRVRDFSPPFTIDFNDWTGKLYEVSAASLLTLSANSIMYDNSCPRMLNCFVPRSVLNVMRQRFGTVFSSIAPDWNFGYRALAVVDSTLYFCRPVLVHYALPRSNGESFNRGIVNAAYRQFRSELSKPVNADAPFPEIITVWNAIISEYCSVKNEAHSPRFPALDMEKYMAALAQGIDQILDPEAQEEMRQRLIARGWQPAARTVRKDELSFVRKLLSPSKVFTKLKAIGTPTVFDTAEQALTYALNHTRPRSKAIPWEQELHQGIEVPLASRDS